MQKSNAAGFTLIEVMIVGAILSILMLGFAGYMYQQARQSKMMSNKNSYEQLKTNVLNAAGQPESLQSSETLQFNDLN